MIEIKNRKAYYNYEIIETIEAGLVLNGTEIKSIKKGMVNISDSYAIISNKEAFLLNMHIAHYEKGNRFNHEESRTRKLLLNKNEILKLEEKVKIMGYSLIPVKLYFKKNKVKILIGIGKGKKLHDKREAIKKEEMNKEAKSQMKKAVREY